MILVIDDETRFRKLYADTLRKAGFGVRCAGSAEEAEKQREEIEPDMIVSDVRMPGIDGITYMRKVKETLPGLPFLLITAYPDIRDAVSALKLGAVDYLEKPVDLDELLSAVSDSLNVKMVRALEEIPENIRKNIIAEDSKTVTLLRDAYRVAKSDASVLLVGESGTGKEVLARFIHKSSERSSKPFVALNCAALPANILASQLFGHERGAFTGAVKRRNGVFREAHGGTLFLDEIGDMPIELQPSLLRALENGCVTPVGNDKEVHVDIRLIAATHKNLKEEVDNNRFREDLFYRLNVISFELPPLRDRKDDILPLAKRFLNELSGSPKRFSPAAKVLIERYSWPGNVREIHNAMERACILANSDIILPEHLPATLKKGESEPDDVKDKPVKTIEELEKEAIFNALDQTGGNRTRAAEMIGISRRTLIYKLKQFED